MFQCVVSDRPPGFRLGDDEQRLVHITSFVPAATRLGAGPEAPVPAPKPPPSSLFLSLLPSKSRAAVADPSCNRMPGWTITLVRSFSNRNKAFPGGRSSKGRSKLGMGFEPATISERPYDQSG